MEAIIIVMENKKRPKLILWMHMNSVHPVHMFFPNKLHIRDSH